ncbi:MAG: hypothetical protein JJE51_10145 [Thermoanaerobaculia bacterium]|nr:hypothetical protein [Thermoanaerobaculia bacterium]
MEHRIETFITNTRNDMTSSPFKWAGIAAGASMVLGLVGRYLRHRMHRPQIIYVD